jgi:putative ABC transport system ATP-binding protein
MVAAVDSRTPVSAATGELLLSVRDVTRSFGDPPRELRVLHGIDLDIHAGQMVLVMGPSGSGKTTLLTILGLLLRPTSGTVRVGESDVTQVSERSMSAIRCRHVSFIFQGFNLLGALTAAENVQVGLELQGIRGRDAVSRSFDLLDRVGLRDRAGHLPRELSGGEQQRVGVARALASPARLILADEPTGNLDGRTSRSVVDLLRRLAHEENRAVVMITHDVRLEPLADRLIRLEDGRVVADERGVKP